MNRLNECDNSTHAYYEWLDEYNADQTQPPETPSASELRAQFSELGSHQAVQIIVNWMERQERMLRGG